MHMDTTICVKSINSAYCNRSNMPIPLILCSTPRCRCAQHIVASGLLAHLAESLHAYRTRGGGDAYGPIVFSKLVMYVVAHVPKAAVKALAAHPTAFFYLVWLVGCPAACVPPMTRTVAAYTLISVATCGALGAREGALKAAHAALIGVAFKRGDEWPQALSTGFPPTAAAAALPAVRTATQRRGTV